MVKKLILDANMFQTLESGCIHSINVRYLSISNSTLLDHIDKGSITNLPLLESLTINNNPSLAYIHPSAIFNVPNLVTLLFNNNNLSALENFRPHIMSLRNIDIKGNTYQCHCSLRWIQNLMKTEERSFGLVVKDGKDITC